jgi:acylphosphatase
MTRRVVLFGVVQGVGFRSFTQRVARRLGVVGAVWNRADGAVELIAQHEREEVLDELVVHLRRGPGHVDSASVEEIDVALDCAEFSIRRDS